MLIGPGAISKKLSLYFLYFFLYNFNNVEILDFPIEYLKEFIFGTNASIDVITIILISKFCFTIFFVIISKIFLVIRKSSETSLS